MAGPGTTQAALPEGPIAAAESLDDLLLRTARGDRAAFARVYDRVSDNVLRITGLVLGDASRAEAACETALVELWRQAPRFDPDRSSATAWIISLAQRHATGLATR